MFDKIDKRLLFELERNARIPETQLAKKLKKSKDTVRYRIKKLEEQGVIKTYKTWIDYSKLGYRSATIYLQTTHIPELKDRLIRELCADPRVYWYGVAEGVWNIGITYFIQNNEDLFSIKNHLLHQYADLITDLQFTFLASVSTHEKLFLDDKPSQITTFTESVSQEPIDSLSTDILREIYFNSRIKLVRVAANCNTTVDKVRSRLKDLETRGIIIRYTIEIDYHKLGLELYKAFIYLNVYDKQDLRLLLDEMNRSKHIINVVKQIAPWEYEFVIFAKNFHEYMVVIEDLTALKKGLIKKIETATMFEDVIFPSDKLLL